MTIFKRIKRLSKAGVLADISVGSSMQEFRKYNLLYGFNGSGKSTLSRMFGAFDPRHPPGMLPSECLFDFEMVDGAEVGSSQEESGLTSRICVFNVDFVDKNFRWAEGKADSIFYMGEEQTDAKNKITALEEKLNKQRDVINTADKDCKKAKKYFTDYCRNQARTIATELQILSRKYEADNLRRDYESDKFSEGCILGESGLNANLEIIRRSEPLPKIPEIAFSLDNSPSVMDKVRGVADVTVGTAVISEFEQYPEMVNWIMDGHEFHKGHDRKSCLFCNGSLSEERLELLSKAVDSSLENLVDDVDNLNRQIQTFKSSTLNAKKEIPETSHFSPDLRDEYSHASELLNVSLSKVSEIFQESLRALANKKDKPTVKVEHSLPSVDEMLASVHQTKSNAAAVNAIIKRHNSVFDEFSQQQKRAATVIKEHRLAGGHDEYRTAKSELESAESGLKKLEDEIQTLEYEIRQLRNKTRTHGVAAEKITKLVASYLGHGELEVVTADEGYELHRRGRLVEGPPSEGEQTAIALCYFLSTLESDGRKLQDLIVVVDDPISSLDTKAMNYTCALLRGALGNCAQVFIFTHNQACMNEFKKMWGNKAKDEQPSASLLFLDVKISAETGERASSIIEMPPLLRAYDSEYHYLCKLVFDLAADEGGDSPYLLIMPNVIRRVLEIFLSFKEPGSHSLREKITALCKKQPSLDQVRMLALERLAQVESHSDNLDDLVAHSSMTIEETREANAALLELMEKADADHFKAMRRQCRPQHEN